MLNKVVSTLQRTARDAGYSTLRNYRGVGGSAGAHDMVEGEVDDAEAALLRQQNPELPLMLRVLLRWVRCRQSRRPIERRGRDGAAVDDGGSGGVASCGAVVG